MLLISGPCYGPGCFFLGSQESNLHSWLYINMGTPSSEMVIPRYFADETLSHDPAWYRAENTWSQWGFYSKKLRYS